MTRVNTARELLQELADLDDVVAENERLKEELAQEKEKVKAAKEAISEMQDTVKNYTGALRRYEHEIHVLYHKVSTLTDFKESPDYIKGRNDDGNRKAMQKNLDKVEPVGLHFANGEPYTLEKYGTLAGMSVNYVNQYPDQQVSFC